MNGIATQSLEGEEVPNQAEAENCKKSIFNSFALQLRLRIRRFKIN
jgi:hypothetical protein